MGPAVLCSAFPGALDPHQQPVLGFAVVTGFVPRWLFVMTLRRCLPEPLPTWQIRPASCRGDWDHADERPDLRVSHGKPPFRWSCSADSLPLATIPTRDHGRHD